MSKFEVGKSYQNSVGQTIKIIHIVTKHNVAYPIVGVLNDKEIIRYSNQGHFLSTESCSVYDIKLPKHFNQGDKVCLDNIREGNRLIVLITRNADQDSSTFEGVILETPKTSGRPVGTYMTSWSKSRYFNM